MPPLRTVLITGASSGIGAALAGVYARNGWNLVLTARRRDRLETLSQDLQTRHGIIAHVLCANLADPSAPVALIAEIDRLGLTLDALVNNAGFSRTEPFVERSPDDHAATVQAMLGAPLSLTRLVLPGMIQRGYGRILNIASIAGLMPATGGDTLYGPVKGFMIQQSTGLHLQLRGTGVHVTALCPGYTRSEFHDANGTRDQIADAYPDWMWQDAATVARIGYLAVEANCARVIPGWRNRLLATLPRILPDSVALRIVAGHARRVRRG